MKKLLLLSLLLPVFAGAQTKKTDQQTPELYSAKHPMIFYLGHSQTTFSTVCRITIEDPAGKTVFDKKYDHERNIRIDLNNLPADVYTIKINGQTRGTYNSTGTIDIAMGNPAYKL